MIDVCSGADRRAVVSVGIRVAVYVVAGRVAGVDIVNQPGVISGVKALIEITVVRDRVIRRVNI